MAVCEVPELDTDPVPPGRTTPTPASALTVQGCGETCDFQAAMDASMSRMAAEMIIELD